MTKATTNKPGHEESRAFVLMEKILRQPTKDWHIKSIVGRVSCPGWLIIEARSASNVEELCQNVRDIHSHQIYVVEPQDGPWHIMEASSYVPQSGSWVRLTKRPYHGDLAFVKEHNDWGAEVYVIPCIKLQPQGSRGKHIHVKDGDHAKYRDPICCEQHLLTEETFRDIWPRHTFKRRGPNDFSFRNQDYLDGFLCLLTDEFQPKEAIPRSARDVSVFEKLCIVSRSCFQRTLEIMGMRCLVIGDPVKVLEGEAQGAAGVITALVENEAIVKIENRTLNVVVSVDVLRKHISLGDQVTVILGLQQGVTGWVTSIEEDLLSIYEHQNARLVDVPSHCVTFAHALVLVGSQVTSTGPAPPGFYEINYVEGKEAFNRPLPPGFHNIFINRELKHVPISKDDANRLGKDKNRHFIDEQVRIICDQSKDYEGVIKSTQQENYVLVELKATLRQEHFHLSNLAKLHNHKMKPLAAPPKQANGTSSNPYPSNPWMSMAVLEGKRIKVNIRNTKPVLDDPGWKAGEYENKARLWIGVTGPFAQVRLGFKVIDVPPPYVRLLHPSVKGQNVIALEGEHYGMQGRVMEVGITTCQIRPDIVRPGTSNRYDIAKNIMAVVGQPNYIINQLMCMFNGFCPFTEENNRARLSFYSGGEYKGKGNV
ncbi:hypothetical protein DXG01_014870 [Tephrocybe rancida]|nr:hypothetical protein DXG01_014870 [Tephrocybe rancida]